MRPAGRQADLFAPRGASPSPATTLRLTALGNAGFRITAGGQSLFLDPFIQMSPSAQPIGQEDVKSGSSILITHDHWDHLNVRAATEAAARGATIIGPEPAIRALSRQVPKESLVQLEPDDVGARAAADIPGGRVTAFRSRHGQAHNSYLLEIAGFRLFDDGDNEHTECLDRLALRDLDALLLCPWQGSGWAGFIEGTKPRHWFLMHMTEEEFRAHDEGKFLPDLCDRVPMEATALRPGESFDITRGPAL